MFFKFIDFGILKSRENFLTLGMAVVLGAVAAPNRLTRTHLNKNSTISILNRTAQVQPDGLWRVAGVASGMVTVRFSLDGAVPRDLV